MDRRLTPANDRVAASSLQGQVAATTFTDGTPAQIGQPVADLCRAPQGARDRQLQFGTPVTVFERRDGWGFVQSGIDGYVGYVREAALIASADATHRVSVPATHLYAAADLKSPDRFWLSFGARLRIVSAEGAFFETDQGLFVPKPHVRPLNAPMHDPVTVAQMHFGAPYLWGGNSMQGIDCSGLVQAACQACGIDCPGDSDLQMAELGTALPPETPPQRGDLLFWKGHVAMVVDADTMIHANAHHMAVAYEPIKAAILRIEEQGEGPVLAHKRL